MFIKMFEEFINERFINLFNKEEKLKYVDIVWDILEKSYASIGGISGNGFTSKQDMIYNIPFWKLCKKDGRIVACVLYKNKNGRKSVVAGTDGSKIGIESMLDIMSSELKTNRSYSEISSKMLTLLKRNHSDLINYLVPYDEVEEVLEEPVIPAEDGDHEVLRHPGFKNYFYQRKIGDKYITKLMIGKTNIPIY